MVATITKGSELAAAVADLDRTQARLHALSSLTAHASSRPASGSVGASTSGTGAGGGGGSSSRFPDLGSPQLSEAQKKIAAKLAKTSGAFEKKPYVVRCVCGRLQRGGQRHPWGREGGGAAQLPNAHTASSSLRGLRAC
jgi:hypothetical protein